MKKLIWFLLLQLLSVSILFAQGKPYEGPDDPAGDVEIEREGYMLGNRIRLYFQNNTELAKWTDSYRGSQWSRWPDTDDGVRMLDGIALLIGAKIYITGDSTPVTNPTDIAAGNYDRELYYLQTSYRERMDTNPTGTVEWGLYPVFGYSNEFSEYPAMSNRADSWPPAGWPGQGDGLKWPGEWNGRFGRGVTYADQETYFVANDAQDLEYLGPEDQVKYYPRPGVYIGDKRSEVTIQSGSPWGGLGVRVALRGFQWNNPQSRDAIFWEYSIANISDYDIPEVAFGYWVDNGIGGESDDELGFFDTKIDMAYSWDKDGKGEAGKSTGTMGFAYLESPGLAFDNEDNDDDGIVDEKRDNPAGSIVDPMFNIYDIDKFLDAYKLTLEDLRDHYEGDEDQDWQDGNDANGDGIYQSSEFAGDDVGLDGVGPNDLNYNGPDQGECNHQPDYIQGVGCEPNFNATDVTESDMIGLTSFYMFPVPQHTPPYTNWFENDESMWTLIGQDSLVEYLGNISNLIETFASSTFPLYQGNEERISMSELHSFDALEGLNSDTHHAPALYEAKRIVQVIYEKDYRFAQPPLMPTLTASSGDGRVVLTWDNVSDTKTRDPFMGNINDFEGYKLFRSTDNRFSDAATITDGFGSASILKPIFQCDIKDDRYGFAEYGAINGAEYNLGYETGLTHHFIDENIQNGRTYYYALVAYDYGDPDTEPGISPSENVIIVELDEAENVRSLPDGSLAIGQNVAIVTPHQPAAGYVPPQIEQNENEDILGRGSIEAEILAKNSLKPGHEYKVKFDIDTIAAISNHNRGLIYTNSGLRIFDMTENDNLVYQESPQNFAYSNLKQVDTLGLDYWYFRYDESISTDVFDGLRLNMEFEVDQAIYDPQNSGWLDGNAAMMVSPANLDVNYFPWDYEIIFTDNDSAHVGIINAQNIKDETGTSVSRRDVLVHVPFNFYVQNTSYMDSSGAFERMDLLVHDVNGNHVYDWKFDRIVVGAVGDNGFWAGTAFSMNFNQIADSTSLPQADDVYRVRHIRPFWESDSITFSVQENTDLDQVELKSTMDDIKVVPNPYVATNAMEQSVSTSTLSQRRRLMFTHLPAECTIKIFTVSGVLVNTIDVQNPVDNGIAHWDLTTREGLEIAAGMYIYHVKSTKTGDEKLGKFAVIK